MPLDQESRFKFIREQKSLTQQQLADKVGLPVHKIKSIETNKAKISVEIALLLEEKFNLSFKWVLTGEGPIYKDETSPQTDIAASITQTVDSREYIQQSGRQARHDTEQQDHPQGKITDLITKTIEILESDTVYSGALSANIDAFHEATRTEKKLRDLQISVESRFKLMDQRVAALETENKKLKDLLDDSPDNGGSLASNQN